MKVRARRRRLRFVHALDSAHAATITSPPPVRGTQRAQAATITRRRRVELSAYSDHRAAAGAWNTAHTSTITAPPPVR